MSDVIKNVEIDFKARTVKESRSLAPAIGSAPPRPIANEIADYKATPQAAKDLLNKVVSKLIDLRCPHCGEAVNVTIET